MSGKKELPLLMASMICGVLCSGGNTTTMSFGELLCDNGETLMLSAPASWNGKLNGSSIAVEFSKNRCRIPCDCKQQNLAELETEIDVPAAGEIRIGCGADWYFEFIVDGSTVYSTWQKGTARPISVVSTTFFRFRCGQADIRSGSVCATEWAE